MYKGKSLAVEFKEERQQIFYGIHEGIGDSCKYKAMTSYRRRDSTYELCRERIFWYNMLGDVGEYVERCQLCQKHGKMQNLISPELQSAPVEHLSYGSYGSYEAD